MASPNDKMLLNDLDQDRLSRDEISDRAITGLQGAGPDLLAQFGAPEPHRRRGFRKRRLKQIGQALLAAVAIGRPFVYWMRFAPASVAVSPVERGEVVAEVMGTGTLEARVKVTVSSKITGRLTTVAVDQGDRQGRAGARPAG